MQGKSHRQVAENLCVCPSTVRRSERLLFSVILHGSVDKRQKHSPNSGSAVPT